MSFNWEEIKNRLDKENEALTLKKRDKGFEKEVKRRERAERYSALIDRRNSTLRQELKAKRRETGYQAHCTGTTLPPWGVEWLNSLEPIKEKTPPPDTEQRKNLLREKWEELQRSKS